MRDALERPWIWIVAALVAFGPFLHVEPGTGNVASDLAAVESLVERGTFFIDGSTWFGTIDKFRRGDRHFSQKSPVFHLALAPVYALCRAFGASFAERPGVAIGALALASATIPAGLLGWLAYRNPWTRARSRRFRLAFALGLFVASPLAAFAATLNHYVAASAFLLAACNALSEGGDASAGEAGRRAPLSLRRLALAGFLASASLACDVAPAFLFGCAVFGWLVLRAVRGEGNPRGPLAFAAGAAPLLLLYAGLNAAIVGSPLPPNLHEEEMLYYEGSYWSELRAEAEAGRPGYYQASYPRRLFHATLGHKGLYWMFPLFAWATGLAVAGAIRSRGEARAIALGAALFAPVAVATTMVWAFDLSGGAYGIRHAFAATIPVYCLSGGAIPFAGGRPLARLAARGCLLWGALLALVGLANPWSHNTFSAWPPIENLARLAVARDPGSRWVERAIDATSVVPANGWLDLALERMARKESAGAERAFRRAIALDPDEPLPYYHLGILLDMSGRTAEAARVYRELLRLEPENAGAWNNLGLFGLKLGDVALAREAYGRSRELSPGNASADWGSLVIEQMEGRADPRSAALAEALARHPNDTRIRALARSWGAPVEDSPE